MFVLYHFEDCHPPVRNNILNWWMAIFKVIFHFMVPIVFVSLVQLTSHDLSPVK